MPLPQLLPELLPQMLACLRYTELQQLRQTCCRGAALPCRANLDALGRRFRARRQRRIWGEWQQLIRGRWLTDRRCHGCTDSLDLPHLFEMRVELEPGMIYAVYFAFCSGCWNDLCSQWSGPFTPPDQWTCQQTQDFVQRAAAQLPPRPTAESPSHPSAVAGLH